MVKTLPRHAENENEKMVPAPTTAWLQHGSAGPIFHGQHRTAEHPDSRYAGDRYFYGGRQLSSERHDSHFPAESRGVADASEGTILYAMVVQWEIVTGSQCKPISFCNREPFS